MELPANRIADLRSQTNESHAALAAVCGVSEITVRRWEAGKSQIDDGQKFKLAEHFGVTPNFLMGWDREPTAPVKETVA